MFGIPVSMCCSMMMKIIKRARMSRPIDSGLCSSFVECLPKKIGSGHTRLMLSITASASTQQLTLYA